jgi:hypothetical protein
MFQVRFHTAADFTAWFHDDRARSYAMVAQD